VIGVQIEANLFQNAFASDLFGKDIGIGMMMGYNPDTEFGAAVHQL
jgi:hypothetical protein